MPLEASDKDGFIESILPIPGRPGARPKFVKPLYNLLRDAKEAYGKTHTDLQCYKYNNVYEVFRTVINTGTYVGSEIYDNLGTDIANIIGRDNFNQNSLNHFLRHRVPDKYVARFLESKS